MDKLVEAVVKGERGAVATLYRIHSTSVRQYLRSKLGRAEDVEELLQDTFISVFDSLSLYRGESSLKTWILSIARHEVADFYRKRYVRQVVEKTAPLFDEIVAELSSPEFEMKKKGIKSQFLQAYSSLKREYQDVLSYRYELGMSVQEVARRMDLPFKATESLLYRARVAFRQAYETRT